LVLEELGQLVHQEKVVVEQIQFFHQSQVQVEVVEHQMDHKMVIVVVQVEVVLMVEQEQMETLPL
tara:strand:+ start:219 stop:413 length:195 start_codon:yes stop_codon:yes gene_type:complete